MQYLTKKNLGLENAMNLETIVQRTQSPKIRQKIDDLNKLLDQEKFISNPNEQIDNHYSIYHFNAEKVKYQQLLDYKIHNLVNHLVRALRPRKLNVGVNKSESIFQGFFFYCD